MGHSDISVMPDTYTHFTFDDAKAEVERLGKPVKSMILEEERHITTPQLHHFRKELDLTKEKHKKAKMLEL